MGMYYGLKTAAHVVNQIRMRSQRMKYLILLILMLTHKANYQRNLYHHGREQD